VNYNWRTCGKTYHILWKHISAFKMNLAHSLDASNVRKMLSSCCLNSINCIVTVSNGNFSLFKHSRSNANPRFLSDKVLGGGGVAIKMS